MPRLRRDLEPTGNDTVMSRQIKAAARRRETITRYVRASLAMIGGFAGLAAAFALIAR